MSKEKSDLILTIVITSLFVLLLVIGAIILFRIYFKRKNTLVMEKERMKIQYEQTLLQSKLEIQEETFTYIAKEIHDNIGQTLSMARLNLNSIEEPEQQQRVELIDAMLEKSIADLRTLSHSLDTDRIRKFGWVHEVKNQLQNLERSGKYKVHMDAEDALPNPPGEKPVILFRMIQEIINNIIKHAKASEIFFSAHHTNNNIIIAIRDNGKGFDTGKTAAGSGLNNLQSRAAMINASTEIKTQPGEGTTITITMHQKDHD